MLKPDVILYITYIHTHPCCRLILMLLYLLASIVLLPIPIQVETLDGSMEVIVPPLTQQGDQLRLRGRGVFNPRRGIKGDHLVNVR